MLKSSFWTDRLRFRLVKLRLRFSGKVKEFSFLHRCGDDSFNDALLFREELLGVLQKQGPFFSLSTSDIQSRQVAIASDSGDVKLFF